MSNQDPEQQDGDPLSENSAYGEIVEEDYFEDEEGGAPLFAEGDEEEEEDDDDSDVSNEEDGDRDSHPWEHPVELRRLLCAPLSREMSVLVSRPAGRGEEASLESVELSREHLEEARRAARLGLVPTHKFVRLEAKRSARNGVDTFDVVVSSIKLMWFFLFNFFF